MLRGPDHIATRTVIPARYRLAVVGLVQAPSRTSATAPALARDAPYVAMYAARPAGRQGAGQPISTRTTPGWRRTRPSTKSRAHAWRWVSRLTTTIDRP